MIQSEVSVDRKEENHGIVIDFSQYLAWHVLTMTNHRYIYA